MEWNDIYMDMKVRILRGSCKGMKGLVNNYDEDSDQVDIFLHDGRIRYLGIDDIEPVKTFSITLEVEETSEHMAYQLMAVAIKKKFKDKIRPRDEDEWFDNSGGTPYDY